MLHHYISNNLSGDHWAINHNGFGEIIVQLQEGGEQVRLKLDTDQAQLFLSVMAQKINQASEQESRGAFIERYAK